MSTTCGSSSVAQVWHIEPFRSRHLPGLRQVFLSARRQAFDWLPADSFRLADLDEQIEGETLLVAVHGEDPVGFVAWWPPGEFIHHLFVAPRWQGRGIGSALLAACLEQIGRPAQLKCLCRNTTALAYYEQRGWRIAKREQGENGEYFLMVFGEALA